MQLVILANWAYKLGHYELSKRGFQCQSIYNIQGFRNTGHTCQGIQEYKLLYIVYLHTKMPYSDLQFFLWLPVKTLNYNLTTRSVVKWQLTRYLITELLF